MVRSVVLFRPMNTDALKLYMLYSSPEHKDGTIEKTKADEQEEHFDGGTTQR